MVRGHFRLFYSERRSSALTPSTRAMTFNSISVTTRDALLRIAACLARDSTDSDCVEEILQIPETLGYPPGGRHDFG